MKAVWEAVKFWRWRSGFVVAAAVLFLILGGLAKMWLDTPGIRFYEAKITEPAKAPKVSVVVPVYNAEKYLRRGLDSLRKQTLKDIEIICVNDGSTDGSVAILAEYAAHDKRIKVITQENRYIGAARNRGLDAARGEYVGFMDADDTVSPNYYADLYKAAKKHNADMAVTPLVNVVKKDLPWWVRGGFPRWNDIFGDGTVAVPMSNREKVRKLLADKEAVGSAQLAEAASYVYIWEVIYRRAMLKAHNIRFPECRCMTEDGYFYYMAGFYADKAAVAPDTAYYLYRAGATTSQGQYKKPNRQEAEMLAELAGFYNDSGRTDDSAQRWKKDFYAYLQLMFAYDYYKFLPADRALWRQWWHELLPEVDVSQAVQEDEADSGMRAVYGSPRRNATDVARLAMTEEERAAGTARLAMTKEEGATDVARLAMTKEEGATGVARLAMTKEDSVPTREEKAGAGHHKTGSGAVQELERKAGAGR